jgi:hypothetical protein
MGTKEIGLGLSLAALLVLSPVLTPPAEAGDCVRIVRAISDVDLTGDAWMWWNAAEGRYERTSAPAVGSVLVFRRTGVMTRGHVSLVSGVIDDRTIEVDHSWLASQGLRRGMRVADVSSGNDWSQVLVWHEPTRTWGTGVFPTYGFIMPHGVHAPDGSGPAVRQAVIPASRAVVAHRTAPARVLVASRTSRSSAQAMIARAPQRATSRAVAHAAGTTGPHASAKAVAAAAAAKPVNPSQRAQSRTVQLASVPPGSSRPEK